VLAGERTNIIALTVDGLVAFIVRCEVDLVKVTSDDKVLYQTEELIVMFGPKPY
jgi:hypothetical protein